MTALNINAGNNGELLAGCKTLKEYMQYVDCVRRYAAMPGIKLEEAVAEAVRECVDKGILADFLRKNKAEAISVSIFEYNEAEEKEKLRRAEYAGGYEAGIAEGIEKGNELKLISLVYKKLQKGEGPDVIAEMLEEDLERIEKICRAIEEAGEAYEPEKILFRLNNPGDTPGEC